MQLARKQAKEHIERGKISLDDNNHMLYMVQIDFYTTWITGYLTAINIQTNDTFNILRRANIAGAMLWIKNYCLNKPLDNIANAAEALVYEFYPNRTTQASAENTVKEELINNTKNKDLNSINNRPSKKQK